MKRFLWLACLCVLCPTAVIGCGDDSGGGSGIEDGGVTPENFGELTDRVDGLEDSLTGLGDDVQGLGDDLGDLGDQLDALSQDARDRLEALENPEILSCSETQSCIPDGFDLVAAGLGDIFGEVCRVHVECCNSAERDFLYGLGIDDREDCVDLIDDIVNNGQSPNFLNGDNWVIQQIVPIVQALNDTDVQIELNTDGITACVASLEDDGCNEPNDNELDEEPFPTRCLPYAPNANSSIEDPCFTANLVTGLEPAGSLCNPRFQWDHDFTECAAGHYCQEIGDSCDYYGGQNCQGICVELPSEGDRCHDDRDCGVDEYSHDMFCNAQNECQKLGELGDDCEYINPTFTFGDWDIHPYYSQYDATISDCRYPFKCSPVTNKCVSDCSDDSLCQVDENPNGDPNYFCPEGLVCNPMVNQDLYDNFDLGVCSQPIANGSPCYGPWWDAACLSNRCTDLDDDGESECEPALAAAGADCDDDSDCQSNSCDSNGECAAACNDNDDCGGDHFCSTQLTWDEDGYNPAYHCVPKIENGFSCGFALGATQDTTCASGFCNDGTCNARAAEGQFCTSNRQCPDTHYCGYDDVDMQNECKPYIALNGNCEGGLTCAGDLVCVVNNSGNDTCQERAGVGEPCSNNGVNEPYCENGLSCEDADGPGVGDALECYSSSGGFPDGTYCEWDGNCSGGFCQQTNNGYVCAQWFDAGDDCDRYDQALDGCGPDAYCNYPADGSSSEGKCTQRGLVGEPCDPRYEGYDCLNGASCTLQNNKFMCDDDAIDPELAICDGE